MRYMMLIYHGSTPLPGTPEWDSLAQEQRDAVASGYRNLNQVAGVTPGEHMQPPEMATTVRVNGGGTLTTDGPFAETKEAVGGYFFLEADNLDAAIELASKVPAAQMGGAVEVRPLVQW